MTKSLLLCLLLTLQSPALAQQAAACGQPAAGQLQLFSLESQVFGNTRMLRVWLPPGYEDPANTSKRYPVLYMFDGQRLFDACTTPAVPYSWHAEATLSRLIAENKIAPMILVGIDNAGEQRTAEYLPWRDIVQSPDMPEPEGTRMPGFVLNEVMPAVSSKFRVATEPENIGIGGSSYGAVAAVYVILQAPAKFGKLLAESTVAWVGNGQLMRDSANIVIAPQRVWFGVGGREAQYPGMHLTDTLQKMSKQLADNFRGASVRDSEVQLRIDPLGGHNEDAWSKRFPDAILFLYSNPALTAK